jgi:hypothetical protein
MTGFGTWCERKRQNSKVSSSLVDNASDGLVWKAGAALFGYLRISLFLDVQLKLKSFHCSISCAIERGKCDEPC